MCQVQRLDFWIYLSLGLVPTIHSGPEQGEYHLKINTSKYLKEEKDNCGQSNLSRRDRKHKGPEMEKCLAHEEGKKRPRGWEAVREGEQ